MSKRQSEENTSETNSQNNMSQMLAECASANEQAAEFNALASNFARFASDEYRVRCSRLSEKMAIKCE